MDYFFWKLLNQTIIIPWECASPLPIMLGGSPRELPNITGRGLTILYYVAPVSLSSYEAHFGSAEQSAEEQLHQCSVCDPAKYKLDEEM
jgi:hypothetical protein